MNDKFDELAKNMAQLTTRREAFKKFGAGLAGMALACFGFANKAEAGKKCLPLNWPCHKDHDCCSGVCGINGFGLRACIG